MDLQLFTSCLEVFYQVDSLCILWISSAELWVATIWTETFTCVSSFLAHICFVLGLHGGSQECHLHSTVNMMVWCYSLIVGEVSVIYLAMVPDCNDIINVSPPYALFCCFQLCEFFCIAQP